MQNKLHVLFYKQNYFWHSINYSESIRNPILYTSNVCHRIIYKVLTFFDLKFLFLLWLHLSAHCRNSFHVLILICRSVLLSRKDCSAIKRANWHNGSNLPFDTSINQICSLYSLYVYLAKIRLFLLFWFIWFWMDPLLLLSK